MLGRTPFYDDGNGQAKMKMPAPKSERLQGKEKKKKASEKVTRKLSHRSPRLQQPYFITQHWSLGGNQAYLAILVLPHHPPPKAIITPQFFTVLCHGENEPQYLSAQCIHKWVRRRTCRYAYTVYVSVCAKKPQTNAKNGHGQWWCSKYVFGSGVPATPEQ